MMMNAPDSLTEHTLQMLCGLRMMAQLEARLGQEKWAKVLPEIDDLIERITAETA
jgi:hypothetical protein